MPTGYERRNTKREGLDLFPTHPAAVRALIPHLTEFGFTPDTKVLEPSAGLGSMADALKEHFRHVECYDIFDWGYEHLDGVRDFLEMKPDDTDAELIVANPPYNDANNHVLKMLELPSVKGAAVLLRTNFIEGQERHEKIFAEQPPRWIIQFSGRLAFRARRVTAFEHGTHAFAWWFWQPGYTGAPSVRWIPEPMKHFRRMDDERYVQHNDPSLDTPAMLEPEE